MNKADQDFNEMFKPVFPPEAYHAGDTWQNKVLYALAEMGEGTSTSVAAELKRLGATEDQTVLEQHTEEVLSGLYNKGLIKGVHQGNAVSYNMSKITQANTGGTDPDLL